MTHSTYLVTHKHEYLDQIQTCIPETPVRLFDGTGFNSFSRLMNECIYSAPTETVLCMSYKVIPTQYHIDKTLDLLNRGYGFVGLYRFGFFGLRKELFRQIGPMDERYPPGFEDNDMYIRLKEANIAAYVTTEVPFLNIQSTWSNYDGGYEWFKKKWGVIHAGPSNVIRLLPEEKYDKYDWGQSDVTKFLPWDKDTVTGYNPNKYTLI